MPVNLKHLKQLMAEAPEGLLKSNAFVNELVNSAPEMIEEIERLRDNEIRWHTLIEILRQEDGEGGHWYQLALKIKPAAESHSQMMKVNSELMEEISDLKTNLDIACEGLKMKEAELEQARKFREAVKNIDGDKVLFIPTDGARVTAQVWKKQIENALNLWKE